jgi:hypothetical protein
VDGNIVTYHWLLLQRVGLVLVEERLDGLLVVGAGLDARQVDPFQLRGVEDLPPTLRMSVDAPAELRQLVFVRAPETAPYE